MIQFKNIKTATDPLFMPLFALYQSAFPVEERRELSVLKQILEHEPRFTMAAVLKQGTFAGFLNYWQFSSFVYVEHFAVNSQLRGQSIGSEVLKTLFRNITIPIILEVEMPENDLAKRRIVFYERLNCTLLPHKYAQPPYDGAGNFLPMQLMTNNYDYAEKHFSHIKNTLYKEVYAYEQ